MQRPSFSIYDASAGSGKTYALVKEYLKIILTAAKNDTYRNILAITFTNKAVHEMKSRIVGSLSEFVKDTPSAKAAELMLDLSEETGLSLASIKTKSEQIIRHIIHNYAAFDISTIDKFTHKVIRTFAHDLNLPITFEVTLDTENLLMEAVDAIIAQAGEDETLTKLLVDFTMEKTDDDKSWDISREILDTGRLILNENNREEITHFKDKSIAEFVATKKKMIEACKSIDDECVDCARSALTMIEDNGIDHASFSAGHFPNHLNYILNNELKPTHKKYHSHEDVKINKAAKDRLLIEGILPELLTILACVYKNHEKKNLYNAFLKNITPLSLLNTVSNELDKIQQEQNILSIAEFNAIIHREIQNQPAPFIYERLGERYRHFFIDEFQDTSEMQWQNLIPLIDNALAGEDELGQKGTLMIVGDPKQSIYRWRGGKAEQFIGLSKEDNPNDKRENPFSNRDKKRFHLEKNYRSYSQIINFNNEFFKLLAGEFENADYKDLYENKSTQALNSKSGGYVNISFLPPVEKHEDDEEAPDKSEMYMVAVFETILKANALGFEYKDVVILVRHNKNGIAIANYLTEQKIPLESSETLMIKNATEVRMIIHILRYLKNNADLEAKAKFLQYVGENIQREMPVHDFIALGISKLDESEFEQWLAGFVTGSPEVLSFQNIRRKALYEAVEAIVAGFTDLTKSNAYVQYFLDIVLERDMRYQAGITDFLEFWDRKSDSFSIPSPQGNNAVRIISIHKSKGLEFPVVILPFAEENYSTQKKDKLWLSAEESELGLPRVLIDNSRAVEGYGEAASLVYGQKKQEELLDNINVLYVALTRAEEQLYVISRAMTPNKDGRYPNNTATFFINYLINKGLYEEHKFEYEIGSPLKLSERVDVHDKIKSIPLIAKTLDPKNIRIARRESVMAGTHQQDAIAYGSLLHEILSFVKTKHDIETAIATATENGLINRTEQPQIRKTIEAVVLHTGLESYFSASNTIMNEQTIIQKEGGTVKPDRMVLTGTNEILLLDYKTGSHLPKYTKQLEHYQYAIEKMNYKVVKKALVYIGENVEVVHL